MKSKLKYILIFFGCVLIFIGYTGLSTGATSLFQITTPLEVIHPSFPSEAYLDVPFFTHDANFIYLNPEGLCRFATRQMILQYWHNKGYVSNVPNQYSLFVEEKQAPFNDTMFEASYINRGLFVVSHTFFGSSDLNWAKYTNHILTRIDIPPELIVNLVKTYISLGIPIDAAVAVNAEGWVDPEGYPVPNHAVVLTGYNTTHIFYNNPISLNLTKPSCGKDKAMPFNYLIEGSRNHLWWIDAVFPKNYDRIVQTVTVQVKTDSTIYTPWESKYTGQNGIVTIHTLKVGCVASINIDIRNLANTYHSFFKATYNKDEWGGWYMFYPDTSTVILPNLDGTLTFEKLTIHNPEEIPNPPINPPEDPKYPYEPQPYYQPTSAPTSNAYYVWWSFIISGFGIVIFSFWKVKI